VILNPLWRRLIQVEIALAIILVFLLYVNLGALSTSVMIAITLLIAFCFFAVYWKSGLHELSQEAS
jgi:hypothetical protein